MEDKRKYGLEEKERKMFLINKEEERAPKVYRRDFQGKRESY